MSFSIFRIPCLSQAYREASVARLLVSCFAAFHVFPAGAADDLTQMPIEALMNVEVSSASKFPQKSTEAPASTTIITAADIKQYGYRTLADALRSVRGFYTSYDRNYEYLGVRGFGRSGDFNSRVLLLVDGHRINDAIYDTAAIGNEFPVDVDLIERIEIVRGPGSSIYGSNAIYGVINVITKSGRDYGGVEAAGAAAGFGTDKERLSYGGEKNGFEWLVSGSRFDRQGENLYFREFDTPENNRGVARHLDGENYNNAFAKAAYAGFTLTGAWSERVKEVPNASYGTLFNDPAYQTTDSYAFANLGYIRQLNDALDFSARFFYNRYAYDGIYPYAGRPVLINKDRVRTEAWGTEMKLSGRTGRHRWLAGAEFQDNFSQDQANFDVAPLSMGLNDRRQSTRTGVYVQDEIGLWQNMLLNAGLRYDHFSAVGDALNPRLGLIWNPWESTTFKLLYGTAFRAPNFYELYYSSSGSQGANPHLKPEKISSYEFIIEHYLQPNLRVGVNGYINHVEHQIDQIIEPSGLLVFRNVGNVESEGAELEVEHIWESGMRMRASYAWQNTRSRNTGSLLVNSPLHMAKLNLSAPVPLWDDKFKAGFELQYVSDRKTLRGDSTSGAVLANLTLLGERIVGGLDISLSLYNLFDQRYAHPGGNELVQDSIIQDGRDFRLKLTYRY